MGQYTENRITGLIEVKVYYASISLRIFNKRFQGLILKK